MSVAPSRFGRASGFSIEWFTPPHVFEALGLEFDLDPCSPPGGLPWIPAKRFYAKEEDGLSRPWHGRIWLNPPYGRGETERWLAKLADHGDGIALVPNRSDAMWWHAIVPRATALCFVRGRIRFLRPGLPASSPPAASVLIAFGLKAGIAVAQSKLGFTVIAPKGDS